KITKEQALAAAKKFFRDCDKDKQGKLDAQALAEGISRLLPRPPGFGAMPAPLLPPPPAPAKDGKDAKDRKDGDPKVLKVAPAFAVFGIGNVLANNIVKRADADKDGKI